VPLAISKPKQPTEPEQRNNVWEPILIDPELAANRWGPTPEDKEPPPNVALSQQWLDITLCFGQLA